MEVPDSSDDEFACGGAAAPAVPRPPPPRRPYHRTAVKAAQTILVFLVADASLTSPLGLMNCWARSDAHGPRYNGVGLAIIGVASITCALSSADTRCNDAAVCMRRGARRIFRGASVLGYAEYLIDTCFGVPPIEVTEEELNGDAVGWLRLMQRARRAFANAGRPLDMLCTAWRCSTPANAIRLSLEHAELLTKGAMPICKAVCKSSRNTARGFLKKKAQAKKTTSSLDTGSACSGA